MRFAPALALATVPMLAAAASAQSTVHIVFENMNPQGGMSFTPAFFGIHDGTADLFDSGAAASPGLELAAELGNTSTLSTEFAAASTGPFGTTATGPIVGGGSASIDLMVNSPTTNRFLSFASMVVPSNDIFVGNDNPTAHELFAADGSFNGPLVIDIFGSNTWDAGTEVNNADDGAAFLQGINGMLGTDENGTVGLFFAQAGAPDYLNSLLGRTTAPGFELTSVFGRGDLIGRITVTPAPSAASVLLTAGLFVRRRRRSA